MDESVEIRFPEDQTEGTEATLAKWLKKPGEPVAAHEPVAEIETDKVMVEVAAPTDGSIIEVRAKVGDELNPGDVLCTFGNPGTSAAESPEGGEADETPEPQASSAPSRPKLSPAVRNRVLEHSINPAAIEGSGREGRVTLKDIESFIAEHAISKAAREATGNATASSPQPDPVSKPTAPSPVPTAPPGESTKIPHDSMRKRIASNMVTSLLETAPHVTAVFEADLTAVIRHRRANMDEYHRQGKPLTYTVYFIAAAVAAIRKVPQVNSRWHEDHLEILSDVNIGIGTALGDEGLIVPVLKLANDKSFSRIAADLADLTNRAREKKLKPEDVRGGTFTISNHGVSGSLVATPIIINQPQSAILGIGKIEKRVKVMEVNGEDVMAIRPMCFVTLTIDHRVLDGFQTNAFLTEFCNTLENWAD